MTSRTEGYTALRKPPSAGGHARRRSTVRRILPDRAGPHTPPELGRVPKASDLLGPSCGIPLGSLGKTAGDAAIRAKDAVANLADEHPVKIEEVIEAASRVPGVRIDRDSYLIGALSVHTTQEMAIGAVETSPAEAGVPEDLIDKLAEEAIAYENNLATATSVAAGLPSNPWPWLA